MSNSFIFSILCFISISTFGQKASIQSKIKAQYSFEENTNDVSENDVQIKKSKTISFSDGILGKSIEFKNSGEYLEIPHRTATLDTVEKAISFWFYTSELKNAYNNLMDKTSGSDYALGIEKSSKKMQFTVHTKTKYTIFEHPIELKKWYFIVISKNTSGIKWYVNGVQKGFTPVVINRGKANPLIVGGGGSPYQHGYDFTGKIDELTFYHSSLTEKEILELYEHKDIIKIKKNETFQVGKVLFKRDHSELLESSYPSLDKILTHLNQKPKSKLLITGHTDNKGSEKHNLKLSLERAKNVRVYFISKGIKKSRIKAKGKGGSEPIASNKTEEGMSQNRRVEFLVY